MAQEVNYGKRNILNGEKCLIPNRMACTACCFVIAVASLNKPARTKCKYQTRDGCSVHGTELQPDECKQFYCVGGRPFPLSNHQKREMIYYLEAGRIIDEQEAETARNLWVIP